MDDENVTKVFTVRGRPVGYRSGKWGGALVAVERGEFPISPTGFRSLSGASEVSVTPALLENLVEAHARERESTLKRMHEARQPVGIPILNYVHVSGAYEQGLLHGFFANDRDRRALWDAAHQLLCLVDSDPRFQPAPKYTFVAWTPEACAKSLAQAREFKALLTCLAAGDFPKTIPLCLLGANAYLELPDKPSGEPKIELSGYTPEMSLHVSATKPNRRERIARKPVASVQSQPKSDEQQLGLFEPPSVATTTLSTSTPVSGPRMSC